MLVLRETELRRAVTLPDAIVAVERAFAALARGEARLPEPIHLEIPESEGEVHLKGAHLAGAPFFAFKVASGFWRNPSRGLPSGSGLMLAFDAATGMPAALLLDGGYLTDLRTGAAGAVAAKHLARGRVQTVTVIGAGVQARLQLEALAVVRDFRRLRIWNRTSARAEACAEEVAEAHGVATEVAASIDAAVRDADVVLTVTPSRTPLVRAEWLRPGVHVTAVGSDGPEKQELDVSVLARADVVVADRLVQCLRLREIHHAVEARTLDPATVAELGDVVLGNAHGRTDEAQITVCDLTGVGIQDAAITALAVERGRALGLGRELDT
jgi:ornithine cyclodeaminase